MIVHMCLPDSTDSLLNNALHPHAAATYTVQESVGVAVELSSAMLLTRKSLEAVGSLEPKEWTGAMENGE